MAAIKLQTTAEMMCAVDVVEEKVYVFLEPSPELIKAFPLGKPDEHQGAHCVSFKLDSEEALEQCTKLTKLCQDVHEFGMEE